MSSVAFCFRSCKSRCCSNADRQMTTRGLINDISCLLLQFTVCIWDDCVKDEWKASLPTSYFHSFDAELHDRTSQFIYDIRTVFNGTEWRKEWVTCRAVAWNHFKNTHVSNCQMHPDSAYSAEAGYSLQVDWKEHELQHMFRARALMACPVVHGMSSRSLYKCTCILALVRTCSHFSEAMRDDSLLNHFTDK